MATKKRRRFAEGGISEAADKEAGLKASKGEKVGFLERLRMGNIDDERSEAYRRFGAGRGRAESVPVEDRVATPVTREMAAPTQIDELEAANAREPIYVQAGPRAEMQPSGRSSVGVSAPAKAPASKASAMQEQTYTRRGGATAEDRASSPRVAPASNPNYSNEGRGRAMTKEQQYARAEAEARSPEGVAKRKKMEEEQGLERVTPETALLPGGSLKLLNEAAKKLAAQKMAKYAQEALPAPTKRLPFDKAGSLARKRSERADMRREEMLKENARRYGLDEESPGYQAAADVVRKNLGGKDFGLKKGGSVKLKPVMKKMASGGSVSAASKRADGIATRGKTRCKIC